MCGREYPNTVMDCCQLEENLQGVKREETTGDPDNGPPDADTSGGPSVSSNHHTNSMAQTSAVTDALMTPTSSVTYITGQNDSQSLPPHTDLEITSTMPPRQLKKRKHTDCENDAREKDEQKFSNPDVTNLSTERNVNKTKIAISEASTTSVRDLETAMSKHLPSVTLKARENFQRPTDFSTDALLKQQQHKSTIQWIGPQNSHFNHFHTVSGSHTSTPASTLLRKLYANRESVIRSNFLGEGRPVGYFSSDSQTNSLPTPPGSEGSVYGEQLSQKSTDLGSIAYGGYADHHSAVTPPGSVSPRDKQQYTLYDNNAFCDALRHPYLGEAPLPLKPQAYSAVTGTLDYASSLDQSQFFHPPPSFHLFHPHSSPSAHSHQSVDKLALSNTNWYS